MTQDLPFGVKYARVVNLIYAVLFIFMGFCLAAIAIPNFIKAAQNAGREASPIILVIVGLIAFAIGLALAILLIILNKALLQLKKRVRIYQIIVSFLLLLCFPLGAVLHGIVLYSMFFDTKTKEAFGILTLPATK